MTSTACRCSALTGAGVPCRAYALTGSAFCWAHSPEVETERAAARARGGRARHGRTLATSGGPLSLRSLADLPGVLDLALSDLLGCEPSVSRARALAALAGVAVKVFEVTELVPRLVRLETGASVTVNWEGV